MIRNQFRVTKVVLEHAEHTHLILHVSLHALRQAVQLQLGGGILHVELS